MRITIALSVMLTTFIFLLMLWRVKMRQHKIILNRMEYFSGASVALRQQELRGKRAATLTARMRLLVRELALKLQEIQKNNRMDLKMQQADLPLMGSEFEVMLAVLGLLFSLITLMATLDFALSLIAFVLGIILGLMALDIYIKKRQKAFTNQLADMLTMIANALRAGFSFMQAFELIAREMDAPVGREVQKVIGEVNVGVSFENALDNMQKRVNSSDFELVVTAVIIQRQVGGNLAQILDTISATIDERIRMRREVMALTAQGRMSGMVLAALPIGVAAMLLIVNPDYLTPLFSDTIGQMCVVGGIFLELIGYVVIRRIVDIKA